MSIRFLLILWFSCSQFARADALTFDKCVQEAEKTNPELQAALSVLQTTCFQLKQAYSNFYPQLTSQISYDFANPSLSVSSASGTFNASLVARYNLFAGQRDRSLVDQAMANRDVAQADVQAVKSQVSFDLKVAFANVLRAQELLRVNENIKAQREASYRLVSLLFDSGRENLGSVLIAQANLDEATATLNQTEEALRSSSIQLSRVIGRDPSEDLRALGSIEVSKPQQNLDFSQLAMQTPTYVKALAQERVAVATKNLLRSEFFPSLDLTSSLSDRTNTADSTRSWMVGISLSYSIFEGGNRYYGFKSAAQAITTAAMTKRASLLNDASTIANAFFAFSNAFRQLDVDQSFIGALTVQEKIATEQYNTGLLSFQNWDLIVSRLFQRQQQVVVAKQNAIVAQATFEKAMGTGVIP